MEDKSDNDRRLCEDGLRNKRSVRKRKPTGRTTVGRETTFHTTVTAPSSQTKTSNPDSCEREKFDGCGRFAVKKRNIQVKEEYVSSGEEDISGKGKEFGSSREEDISRKGKEHVTFRETDTSEKGEHGSFREADTFRKGEECVSSRKVDRSEKGKRGSSREDDTSGKGEEHVSFREADTFRKGEQRVSFREADRAEKGKRGSSREADIPEKGEEHGSSREADTSEKGEEHGSSREADTFRKGEQRVSSREADRAEKGKLGSSREDDTSGKEKEHGSSREGEQRVSSREADRAEKGKRGSSREDDTSGKEKEHVSSAEEAPSPGEGDLGSIETVEDSPVTQHKQGWDMLKFNIGRSREISEDLRKQVVEAHKSGKGYKRIAKDLDLHQSTVRQIVYKWKKFSTVATLPRSGRPTKIGAKARRTILKHLTENPRVTAKDLKASLALDNINVHESTIRKTLNKWCSWDFIMEEDTAVQPE
ncbi:spore wall protein 2-like isoform X2 [Rana temporaria]|uniref:spore wall protein 2-like isoform X2 n=1 Tax=Rana temporaria TaxID=8407 RepID=UPI001AADD99E|nr:spore wall protein 2-like isoform X2 [Rana temporaria]